MLHVIERTLTDITLEFVDAADAVYGGHADGVDGVGLPLLHLQDLPAAVQEPRPDADVAVHPADPERAELRAAQHVRDVDRCKAPRLLVDLSRVRGNDDDDDFRW